MRGWQEIDWRIAGFRRWPLSAKVVAALTCALLPLGVLATLATATVYADISANPGRVSVERWFGLALPLLMWLAALLIGWRIADRLLVRPLSRMRDAVERYGRGETLIRLGASDFLSHEMTALAHAFDAMADDIDRHDMALRGALDEQTRLTREVHHRVKNNLQIVSSLLSIEARETRSPEIARAYSTLQTRVGALALVHRWMYDDARTHGVDLRALATDLCAALEQGLAASEGATPKLECSVERFFVGQDTAVPLAFLITELVSLAARRAAPAAAGVGIEAAATGGTARLTIRSKPFCDDDIGGKSDAAARIVQGMARQLRSPLIHDPAECTYTIAFAVPTGETPRP